MVVEHALQRLCADGKRPFLPHSSTLLSLWVSGRANAQSLRALKPTARNNVRRFANAQGVSEKNENLNTVIVSNIRPTLPVSDGSNQSKLVRLAIHSGIYEHGLKLEKKEIAGLVPPSDWNDADNCTLEELKAWGACLAMRAVRYRGQVPNGWDQVANCKHCGPVYQYAAGDYQFCPWCELKRAGKWFPAPQKGKLKL